MNIRNRNMDETLGKLLEIVSRITKINKNEINIHENLVEMGMDSIVFTRINHSIIQHFGIEIPFSKVYEELTNLQKISGYLVEKTKSNSTLNKSVSSLSSGAPSGLAAAIETEVDEITSSRYKDIQKLITKAKSQTILNDEKRRSDERFIYEMPLTKEQESILVQNDFSSSAFNEAVALSIQGNIDKELLEESINIVVERHESLRTIINQDTKMQQILKDRPITLKVMNNYQLETNKVVNNFVNQPFDLAEGLFRAVLIEESENQFVFVIVIHHIIADGWSIGVLLSEITEVFNNIINDKILDMNEPLQFREFIQARDEWSNLNEEKGTLLREKYYSKTENFVDLNFNYKPKSKGYTGARLDLIDNNDILQQLRRISAKNKTSLFHTMLSSFIAFISRVSQNKHITVGVPFAGQNIMNAETLIGNCVEMIGVHLEVEETDNLNIVSRKVSEFLEELNETGFLHKNNSEQSYNVVFNMIKNVNNSFNGTECQFFPIGISESKYDLFLTIIEFNNQVIMRFDYNQEVISERTINRWACYFKNILNAKIKEDNTAVSEISIFSDEEVDSIHQLSAYSYDYINHKLKADLLQYGLAEGEEVKVFILDKNMMLLPIGMIGEIYIGPNNVEIYNTNHLGKLSDTGHLTILGEEDKQIVIKGRKVSLFTIEEHIRNIPVVKDVICEYDVQNSDLTAYVELGMPIKDSSELTLALRKSLPAFMIPTSLIKVDNLENKMDGELIGHYEQLTYTESELISIWKEILDVKNVDVEDDFFQLGGNSLKAMRVLARIQKDFNKTIQIKDLFFNPTVRHIASIIDAASVDEKEQIQLIKVSHEEYYPVSSVQKRMYMLNKIEPESLNYNISTAIRLEGQVNIERLKNSVNNIIKRHESLRTYFDEVNGTVVQKIEESLELNIEYSYKENFLNEDEFMDREISGFLKSFDLNKLPLFRVKILKLQRNLHIVLLDTHHIIFDGTSSGILLQELVADYNGLKLPELKVQYKDFVQWESQLNTKEERAKSESYWKDLFQENIPVLSIQTDYPRPVNQTFNGQIVSLVLDRKLSDQIEKYCSINKITPYMFFVATINILLAKYSGQEDIVLGTTIDGRNHPDLNNLIGMFVNTIPLRNKYEPNHTFDDFTNKVKENTLQAFEYSNYQFEDLIDLLDLKRDVSRNPLFDVLFTYQNNLVSHIESDDFEIRTYEIKKEGSKVDLFFEVLQDTEFTCNIEYNSDLFSEGTIKRMGLHFHSLIMRLLNQTSEELKNIEILTENESLELLETFNDTGAIYSTEKTIHQFFEEQVVQVPENTAVVFAGKRLSYRELNERANQIAWVLRDKGVKPDQTVGIMVERSLEMIVGILAILKAGGAYLPIDPTHPSD
ncbi:condensation domain-containing protein, partial [Niallia taxi]|uniref:condensation domain-containing protein n=1 Tax=Niallia taxi TaxID=2499688 RepID=UPI0021A3E99E